MSKSRGIGLRTIKTAIAVGLALLVKLILVLAIDLPTGSAWSKIIYTPFFGAIAAAYSMHANKNSSLKQAKIRTMGSLVGGLYGMAVLILCEALFIHAFNMDQTSALYYVLDYIVVAIAIIPMIQLTVMTKTTYATWIACLTYLSVTVSIRNDFDDQLAGVFSQNPIYNGYVIAIIFAINRILSTVVGVGISLGVNMFKLPHKTKNKDILFCVGIEGVLGPDSATLVGYTNYQLNHMVSVGANCTLFTTRIPRTFMHLFGNLDINQPVVCMSGAALYDAKRLTYLGTEPISYETSVKVDEVLKEFSISPFKNYVYDDVLNVYCEHLDNLGEELMAKRMKNGGYGNYFTGVCPKENMPVLFYLMIEKKDRVPEIIEALNKAGLSDDIVLQQYDYFDMDSDLVSDLKYVKIYSKKILELNLLKEYAKRNNLRIAGLTTSPMSEHLLNNSEIKVTSTDYSNVDFKIDSYNTMFKTISKIYYSADYKNKESQVD